METFTKEEIKSAKAVRDEIISGDVSELKSIYMAGEIVMWDEMNQMPTTEKIVKSFDEFLDIYVEGSAIKEIKYVAETKQWIVSYKHDVLDDKFKSAKGMIEFFHADQLSGAE